MDLDAMCEALSEVERDRLTAAEICIDEALTIMDRHGLKGHDPIYRALAAMSGTFDRAMTAADGPVERDRRLRKVRDVLTAAMPLTDADLGVN